MAKERSNEEELDLFADLLEPAAEILSDEEFTNAVQIPEKRLKAISIAIRNHKKAIIEILARIDDVPIEEYKVNLLALPVKLLSFVNRPEVQSLFTGQEQRKNAESSGPATENTEDGAN